MKVKTLLKTFRDTEYILQNPSGYTLENGFVSGKYFDGESSFENNAVVEIWTRRDDDKIFVTIK